MKLDNLKKLTFVCIFSILLLVQGNFYAYAGKINVDIKKLDKYIEKSRQEWKIPGLAVAIVKDGKVVLAKGYGLRQFDKDLKVDENTLFAIASNTKAFTSAALAMLVDEEKLDWNDKVHRLLPYFELYDPFVTAEITVKDLLCHRSGLGTFSGDLLWYETPYNTVEVLKRARYLKPKFGFRDGYGYSNIMFMTAGEVVPAVTGISWKEFVQERIFKPLGMKTTNIGTTDLKKYDNVATPHYVYPDGKTVTVPYTSSDCVAGAAAINSNVADLAKWLIMLLNEGKVGETQLLSQKALDQLWTPINSFTVSAAARKRLSMTNFRGYGLGWSLSDYRGMKLIGHGGALDGMISQVMLVPELNLGAVVLTNSINSLPPALEYRILDAYQGATPKDWSTEFLDRLKKYQEREMKAEKEAEQEKPLPKFQVNLEDYAGLYAGPMYGDATIKIAKDRLELNLVPAPIFISDLTPLHFDTFLLKLRNTFSFIPKGEGTVQFLRDKKGKVVEMIVDIPNNDFFFTELEFKKQEKEKKD